MTTAAKAMQNQQQLSSETIARMAEELLGIAVDNEQLQAVAALVSGLVSEMAPMRAMEVGNTEPATTYDASRP